MELLYVAERAEAVKDLQIQIEELTASRKVDVSEALAQQSGEIDFLKAELTSTKVRLHDALSQSQAEKDALIRHADTSRAELLQQLEVLRRGLCPDDETKNRSQHIVSDELIVSEHTPKLEAMSHDMYNSTSFWKKLELLRELVTTEKDKWNLEQAGASDSQQLDADVCDGTTNEATQCSHKIRSSWAVLEEQVLPLIENFCSAVDEGSRPSNSEPVENAKCVLDGRENVTLLGSGDGHISDQEETLQSVRRELEEEKQEVNHLNDVRSEMCENDDAMYEMEVKHVELQAELDSVYEQLRSQEELVKNLSSNVELANEQLKQRMAEMSDKDGDIHRLNAEIDEMKAQTSQQLIDKDADVQRLNAEIDELKAQVSQWSLEKDADVQRLNAEVEELKAHTSQQLLDKDAYVQRLNVEMDELQAQTSQQLLDKDSNVQRLNAKMDELKARTSQQLIDKDADVQRLNVEMDELQAQMSQQLIDKDADVQRLDAEMDELQAQMSQQLLDKDANIQRLNAEVEELKAQTSQQLLDKDADIQRLNAEVEELKAQTSQQLLVLQTDSDEKLNSERKTWQTLIDTKAEELLTKCTELDQRELKLKALSDQCSAVTAERDANVAEILNNNAQIDSLTREISVLKEQLNAKTVELHEAQTRTEHELRLLQGETECEALAMNFKITTLEDEISSLQQQLDNKSVELVSKDEALTLLENKADSEQREFKTKIARLEDQLSSDQKSAMEQLVSLKEEVKMKEALIREREEAHETYRQHTDSKLAELATAVSVKDGDRESLIEQHKAELLQKSETFNEEIAKLTGTHEEQLASVNNTISDLTKSKHDLESEVKILSDKLALECENVARLEKDVTDLSLVKEEREHHVTELRCTLAADMEHEIKLREEQITALKSALSEKDQSLSLLNAALCQTCREDIRSVDSCSHTVVINSGDGNNEAEVSDMVSGDVGCNTSELADQQLSSSQNYDVSMMVRQINLLGDANAGLRDKIGRLEADLLHIRQTDMKPVDESPQCELASVSQPPTTSCSSGLLQFLLHFHKTHKSVRNIYIHWTLIMVTCFSIMQIHLYCSCSNGS